MAELKFLPIHSRTVFELLNIFWPMKEFNGSFIIGIFN